MANSSAYPMIIDTDGGVDDALAIVMALNCESIDLKAITVLAGNIDVHQAANNVRASDRHCSACSRSSGC
ncbi:nucleoside hydrolase [Kovacikia minuta]|uniref:nucleoside hydrolase n=1 Tax=Kovacikia minuta TaxID=2931930 RepID=UPI0020C79CA2|nr:nucleoside hydrolase [Kovacikia minuta]